MEHQRKGFPDSSASAYKRCPSRSRATQGTLCSRAHYAARSHAARFHASFVAQFFKIPHRPCALTAASACHQQGPESPSAISLLNSILYAILLFYDSIAEQRPLARPVMMGKLHACAVYQTNPSLLSAASAYHHAHAAHICAGRNCVKVQNLGSLVSYLAVYILTPKGVVVAFSFFFEVQIMWCRGCSSWWSSCKPDR